MIVDSNGLRRSHRAKFWVVVGAALNLAILLVAVVPPALAAKPAAAPSASPPSGPVSARTNVVYGHAPNGSKLTEDVYIPTARSGKSPMVLLVHGGAFAAGDKASLTPYAQGLAATGYVVANIDYSLVPVGGRGYPEQVHEVQQAVAWNARHVAEFGATPNKLALVGFSAGGYLAAFAGVTANHAPRRPVRAVVTLSAPLDMGSIMALARARIKECGYHTSCTAMPNSPPLSAFREMFGFIGCPNGGCSAHLLKASSPVAHVTRNAPAFLLLNSRHELIPASQPHAMAAALAANSVAHSVHILPGNAHGAAYLPQEANRISRFLRKALGSGASDVTPDANPITAPAGTAASPNPLTIALSGGFAVVGVSAAGIAIALWRRRDRGAPFVESSPDRVGDEPA